MKALSLFLAAVAMAASATVAISAPATGLHYGDAFPLGAGTARAWVAVDVDGAPVSMGVSLDEKAVRSRPKRDAAIEARLPLPASVQMRPGVAATSRDASKATVPAFVVRYDRSTRAYVVVYDGFVPVAQLLSTR